MPVLAILTFFGFISRFFTPAVPPMATMTKKMHADERASDKYPNPVLCKPNHFSLPLRDYGSFHSQTVCRPTLVSYSRVSI